MEWLSALRKIMSKFNWDTNNSHTSIYSFQVSENHILKKLIKYTTFSIVL